MNPWPVEEEIAEVHLPRPGHADLVGTQKYKQSDVRNILERASARETAARVAGGALCKAFLRALGVEVYSHVVQIASVQRARARASRSRRPTSPTSTPRRCAAWTPRPRRRWCAEIDDLRRANESLGGVFEVQAFGLRPGTRLARLLGGAPRRAPGDGDLLDPGDQGRLDRRRLHDRRRCRARPPTTRSSTRPSAATTARPTAPAASRAA